MDTRAAVSALGALAQDSRLAIFRGLVRSGPDGLAAGDLAAQLGMPPSTLSFHLHDLTAAGLLGARRTGRSIRYSVRASVWTDLLWFLGEDCCQGRPSLCTSPAARIHAAAAASRRDADRRPRVLFLCSQNSARSQLAEALLRHLGGDRFEVHSAGVRPTTLHPLTKAVLDEAGIPTVGLRSKDLGELLGKEAFDHAIVVCAAAQRDCPQLPRLARDQQFWPFPDPAAASGTKAQRLAGFRSVRDAIEQRLRVWLRTVVPGAAVASKRSNARRSALPPRTPS